MRNLLGRLNAREPDELGRIAAAWQVVVSGGDKLGQVAQLYQAMTDLRAGRDLWTRLPEDERALIAVLALAPGQDAARPLADLARELGQPESELRRVAVRLYHKGILTREGDDDPLPVGEAPRLFMPRELAGLFRRVMDEIEAGDISTTPLRTLLALLDDREVEEAAEAWGMRVIPGIRTRTEIIQGLLAQVSRQDRLPDVRKRLPRDAVKILERVEASSGDPVPFAEAHLAAGLTPDTGRDAQRLRKALAELEEALLVWHTYRSDGSRWLFMPVEIRVPGSTGMQVSLPPAVDPGETAPDTRHAHAVAWDLLTLLRALSAPLEHTILDVNQAPVPWLRRLNAGLWNKGGDRPPAGYLDFLVDLARVEGVLTGGDPAIEEPFQVSASVRQWRSRSFTEQTGRLRSTWLGSSSWIEGNAREDVDVEGADWAGFRLKIVNLLGSLPAGSWHELEALASWLAERDPDLLGAHFTVATARSIDVAGDPAATRRAAIAQVALATLETGFAWFGLIELAKPAGKPRIARVSDRLQPVPAPDAESATTSPPLAVDDAGRIRLLDPSPLRIWSISAFADLVTLAPVTEYLLSEQSIGRALKAGFNPADIERFLTTQSGGHLPPQVQAQVHGWSKQIRRVRLARTVQLTPDDPSELTDLVSELTSSGFSAIASGESVLVTMTDDVEQTPAEAALLSLLRDTGFTPHGLSAARRLDRRERRP